MPETAQPREPGGPAPDQGGGKAPSAPSREQKRDEPVVWPRGMNALRIMGMELHDFFILLELRV